MCVGRKPICTPIFEYVPHCQPSKSDSPGVAVLHSKYSSTQKTASYAGWTPGKSSQGSISLVIPLLLEFQAVGEASIPAWPGAILS
jgi:hypothetical protein